MAKKPTTAVIVKSPELTKNLAILEAFKADIDLQAQNCMQIKIVDESTLAIAQQNLSKINQLVSSVEAKRSEIKDPYFQAGKQIDATAKSLVEEAIKAVEHLKNEVKSWELEKKKLAAQAAEEQARKAAENEALLKAEEERKSKIREAIDRATKTLQDCYARCINEEASVSQIEYINEGYKPREFFEEFADEAYALKDNYIGLINTKIEQFKRADTMSAEEKALIAEKEELNRQKLELATKEASIKAKEAAIEAERLRKEQEEADRLEAEKQAALAEADKTKGIRYNWKFECVDPSKLIADWIKMDDDKVKEFLKENKDTLEDGVIVNGVKFFKNMSVVA